MTARTRFILPVILAVVTAPLCGLADKPEPPPQEVHLTIHVDGPASVEVIQNKPTAVPEKPKAVAKTAKPVAAKAKPAVKGQPKTLQATKPDKAPVTGKEEKESGTNLGLLMFVFVLAIFLGVELISRVPSQLHTPLMSGSNAISGITIVGALIAAGIGGENGKISVLLGTLAVAFAMINVVGGYLVTDRMLGMFKHKDKGGVQ